MNDKALCCICGKEGEFNSEILTAYFSLNDTGGFMFIHPECDPGKRIQGIGVNTDDDEFGVELATTNEFSK